MSQDDRTTGLLGYSGAKIPVRVASTTNQATIAGLLTIDGVVLVADDRVLLTGQTTQTENGIWVADTGSWERAKDCDGSYDLVKGSLVYVTSGTTNSGFWICGATNPVVVGSSNITFTIASSVLAVINALWQVVLATTTTATARTALGVGDIAPVSAVSGTNTILGTIPAENSAYATNGLYVLIPAGTNTGATTANFTPSGGAALGAKNVFWNGAALVGGELRVSVPAILEYDGTRFNIVGNGASIPMSLADIGVCEGRLTLTSGTPVTTGDVLAAETLYFTPFNGNRVATYNGTQWELNTFTELSIDVPDVTGVHDVFLVKSAGALALEVLVWTNDTARATALTSQDGVLSKSGQTTRRYLGTFYSTTAGNGQIEDSVAKRNLFNYYNRRARPMKVLEATNTWNYTTATFRQAGAVATNQLEYTCGVSEDPVTARVDAVATNSGGGIAATVGIGVDSTTVDSSLTRSPGIVLTSATPVDATYFGFPGVGRHTIPWLEYSAASGTTTWYGDNNTPTTMQSGIQGSVMG